MDDDKKLKMIIFGNKYSSKTKLIYQFIKSRIYPNELEPQVEDIYNVWIKLEGHDYEIAILDTAGEEDYQNMVDCWIEFGEGFILLFNIDNKESFEYVKNKYNKIIILKKEVPILLVGNIMDEKEERQVSFEDAADFAFSKKIEYIEISIQNNFNCEKPFEIIAKEILMKRSGQFKKYKKNIKNSEPSNMITKRKEINLNSLFKYTNF